MCSLEVRTETLTVRDLPSIRYMCMWLWNFLLKSFTFSVIIWVGMAQGRRGLEYHYNWTRVFRHDLFTRVCGSLKLVSRSVVSPIRALPHGHLLTSPIHRMVETLSEVFFCIGQNSACASLKLRSALVEVLHGVDWWFLNDVSGRPIVANLKG